MSYYKSESQAREHRDQIRQNLNDSLTRIIKAEVISIDVIPKPLDTLQLPEEIGELVERCMALQIKMANLPEGSPLFNSSQEILGEEYRSHMSLLAESLDRENFEYETFIPYLTGRQVKWLRENKGNLLQYLEGVIV